MSERQEKQVNTQLFGKGQRTITDKYRKGYSSINWDKSTSDAVKGKKGGFKVIRRGSRAALRDSDSKCMECRLTDCTQC